MGFVWFRSETRTDKLFVPQSSKAVKDLETAEKYFRIKFREEIVLLVAAPGHPNVLSPECLRQAFRAHKAVMNLESYVDFCVTLSGNKSRSPEDCVMTNPLEFLQFNEINLIGKDLTQVQLELNKAANDTSLVTRNGRPFWFNLDGVFGSITRKQEIITGAKALQMIYPIRAPSDDDAYEDVLKWETKFIEKMASLVDKLSCFEVHYSSERSMDDAIDESTGSDVTLVSITFTLMISFACIMLGKFFNPLTGHSLLANTPAIASKEWQVLQSADRPFLACYRRSVCSGPRHFSRTWTGHVVPRAVCQFRRNPAVPCSWDRYRRYVHYGR